MLFVLKPISLSSTAFNIMDVSTNPFIKISASPLLTKDTALLAASCRSLASTSWILVKSKLTSSAILVIFSLSPTKIGTQILSLTASLIAFKTS